MAISILNKFFSTRASYTALSVVAALTLTACSESTSSTQGEQFGSPSTPTTPTPPTTPGDDFAQEQLLASIVDNVLLPTYNQFATDAANQLSAVTTYCSALGDQSSNSADALAAAQASWRAAMSTWQLAEVMQLGPLLDNNNSLRNRIYSWPNVSTCAVDQDVVLAEDAGYDVTARTNSRKGLDALEYLLFNDNLAHSCTQFGTEPQGWNNRTDADRMAARCAFSQIVATDVVTNANELVSAWTGSNGQSGYAEILRNAGQPGSEFTDVHDAVNDVSDALFYIDSSTKDAKLATPLGVFANDCGLEVCVENLESQFAQHSLQNVLANIRALSLIYQGGESEEGVGFDDYLVDVGDEETAMRMRDDIAQAIALAESLDMSLAELLTQDPEQVQALHDRIKDVTDSMKTDFIQSLALELPATSAGDND